MRFFNGLLFLGDGKVSEAKAAFLRHRLDEAIELSGGLQQPDRAESEGHHERLKAARVADEGKLEEAVLDLVAALTGRLVTFGDPLPYPPDQSALERVLGLRGPDLRGTPPS